MPEEKSNDLIETTKNMSKPEHTPEVAFMSAVNLLYELEMGLIEEDELRKLAAYEQRLVSAGFCLRVSKPNQWGTEVQWPPTTLGFITNNVLKEINDQLQHSENFDAKSLLLEYYEEQLQLAGFGDHYGDTEVERLKRELEDLRLGREKEFIGYKSEDSNYSMQVEAAKKEAPDNGVSDHVACNASVEVTAVISDEVEEACSDYASADKSELEVFRLRKEKVVLCVPAENTSGDVSVESTIVDASDNESDHGVSCVSLVVATDTSNDVPEACSKNSKTAGKVNTRNAVEAEKVDASYDGESYQGEFNVSVVVKAENSNDTTSVCSENVPAFTSELEVFILGKGDSGSDVSVEAAKENTSDGDESETASDVTLIDTADSTLATIRECSENISCDALEKSVARISRKIVDPNMSPNGDTKEVSKSVSDDISGKTPPQPVGIPSEDCSQAGSTISEDVTDDSFNETASDIAGSDADGTLEAATYFDIAISNAVKDEVLWQKLLSLLMPSYEDQRPAENPNRPNTDVLKAIQAVPATSRNVPDNRFDRCEESEKDCSEVADENTNKDTDNASGVADEVLEETTDANDEKVPANITWRLIQFDSPSVPIRPCQQRKAEDTSPLDPRVKYVTINGKPFRKVVVARRRLQFPVDWFSTDSPPPPGFKKCYAELYEDQPLTCKAFAFYIRLKYIDEQLEVANELQAHLSRRERERVVAAFDKHLANLRTLASMEVQNSRPRRQPIEKQEWRRKLILWLFSRDFRKPFGVSSNPLRFDDPYTARASDCAERIKMVEVQLATADAQQALQIIREFNAIVRWFHRRYDLPIPGYPYTAENPVPLPADLDDLRRRKNRALKDYNYSLAPQHKTLLRDLQSEFKRKMAIFKESDKGRAYYS